MLKNLRSKLIWLAIMVAGFVLIDIGEFTGIVNSFIENALVTIGINIILAVGLTSLSAFPVSFHWVTPGLWQSERMRLLLSRKIWRPRLAFTLPCYWGW